VWIESSVYWRQIFTPWTGLMLSHCISLFLLHYLLVLHSYLSHTYGDNWGSSVTIRKSTNPSTSQKVISSAASTLNRLFSYRSEPPFFIKLTPIPPFLFWMSENINHSS
jgi:hypothetical protein